MNASEFKKQPRGPYAFDFYVHPTPVPSTLGEFTVELQMGVGDTSPPDEAMVDVARELVRRFTRDREQIAQLVFDQYRSAADDEDWLDFCDMPDGLSVNELAPYLEARTLTVSRDLDNSHEPYPARVYMSPHWDEEHGLYFKYEGDEWVQVDC